MCPDVCGALVADADVAGGRRLVERSAAGRPVDGGQRPGLVLVAVVLGAATIVSHQLTPVVLVLSLSALVVTGRSWTCRLPVVLGLLLLAWLATGASSYLAGHPVLPDPPGGIRRGQRDAQVGRQRWPRVRRAGAHAAVRRHVRAGRRSGSVRRRRAQRSARSFDSLLIVPAVLFVVPFLLVPANSYGGEMLLRATLFALPFMAVLIADAFPLGAALEPAEPPAGSRAGPAGTPRRRSSPCGRRPPCSPGTATPGSTCSPQNEIDAVEEMYRIASRRRRARLGRAPDPVAPPSLHGLSLHHVPRGLP